MKDLCFVFGKMCYCCYNKNYFVKYCLIELLYNLKKIYVVGVLDDEDLYEDIEFFIGIV